MSGTADIDGTTLAYEVRGTGPAVVWGHGLTGSIAAERAFELVRWDDVAERGHTVVRYDARGHGRSGFTAEPSAYSWQALARDQLALADHLGIDRYVAAGASMGCGTALHAAVLAPERVTALVLVIPPTAWESRAARVEIWGQMAAVAEERGTAALAEAMMALPPADPLAGDAEHDAARRANLEAIEPYRLAGVLRGAGTADLPARRGHRAARPAEPDPGVDR